LGTHFLARTRGDRLADGGPDTVAEVIGQSPLRGLYRIAIRNRKGEESEAVLKIRFRRLRIQTAKGERKHYKRAFISLVEIGKTNPSLRSIFDICSSLDMKPSAFLRQIEQVSGFELPAGLY
jgi:transcriptional regulator with XRE-family HTH domain